MRLDDRTKALVKRIRSEANIADRPGSYDRLQAIADDLKKLEPAIRADEQERWKGMLTALTRQLLDQRIDLRAQVMEKRERWMDEDGDEAAGRRMTYNEVLDLLNGESFSEVSPGAGTTTGTETLDG